MQLVLGMLTALEYTISLYLMERRRIGRVWYGTASVPETNTLSRRRSTTRQRLLQAVTM